jgi:hypothetical protein
MWSSIDEATDRGSARPTMHYMPFEVVQKLDYKPAFDMARTYDPMSMFVVVIAIRTNDARDSIMHSALLPASVSDSFLPTLENTAALQRINLSAPEPAEQNEDEDDFASLGFAALLSPFAPEVHARLTADSDHTLTDLFGANSAFTGLASGLSVAAPGDMPVSLKLTSTMCAWPACTHEYPLPCVSVQPAAAEEPAAESFPAESNAASDTVEPTQSESSEPAEPAQPLAASEQFSFPFPYFPVSTDPADQRCWCSDCFLQTYCSSDCQAKHWEHNHAQLCQRIRLSFLTQKCAIRQCSEHVHHFLLNSFCFCLLFQCKSMKQPFHPSPPRNRKRRRKSQRLWLCNQK